MLTFSKIIKIIQLPKSMTCQNETEKLREENRTLKSVLSKLEKDYAKIAQGKK